MHTSNEQFSLTAKQVSHARLAAFLSKLRPLHRSKNFVLQMSSSGTFVPTGTPIATSSCRVTAAVARQVLQRPERVRRTTYYEYGDERITIAIQAISAQLIKYVVPINKEINQCVCVTPNYDEISKIIYGPTAAANTVRTRNTDR